MRALLAARVVAPLGLLRATLSACVATATTDARPSSSAPGRIVYAAIGASETFGIGAGDRSRQAWPQVFTTDVLPRSAVLYNFGIPGATTAQALARLRAPRAVVYGYYSRLDAAGQRHTRAHADGGNDPVFSVGPFDGHPVLNALFAARGRDLSTAEAIDGFIDRDLPFSAVAAVRAAGSPREAPGAAD